MATIRQHPSLAWLKASLTPESTQLLVESARLAKTFGAPDDGAVQPEFIFTAAFNISTGICRKFTEYVNADIPDFRTLLIPALSDTYERDFAEISNLIQKIPKPKTLTFSKNSKNILQSAVRNWRKTQSPDQPLPADYILAALFACEKPLELLDYTLLEFSVERYDLFDILTQISEHLNYESTALTLEELSSVQLTVGKQTFVIHFEKEESSPFSQEALAIVEKHLSSTVIGQPEAISAIMHALERYHTGLKTPDKPIATFLFAGYTGVGKTSLVRHLAEVTNMPLLSLNMSEYSERHTVSRLFGSPPGYIGSDEGGQLTNFVMRNPNSIILFDEIEKAHPDIYNVLLQITGENASLSDSKGNIANFNNTIIVLTSNLGARDANKPSLGFSNTSTKAKDTTIFQKAVTDHFRPELISRIGPKNILVFNKLDSDGLLNVTRLELAKVAAYLKDSKNIKLRFTSNVAPHIAASIDNNLYGARDISTTIQHLITDALAEFLLSSTLPPKSVISVSYKPSGYFFRTTKK